MFSLENIIYIQTDKTKSTEIRNVKRRLYIPTHTKNVFFVNKNHYKSLIYMVEVSSDTSNRLFEVLALWEEVLK